MTKESDVKYAYISGPRDVNNYIEAGKYLGTMGYIALNVFEITFDGKDKLERDKRLAAVKGSDLIFMLEGWMGCIEAVDEWDAAVYFNREKNTDIGISYPEFRG